MEPGAEASSETIPLPENQKPQAPARWALLLISFVFCLIFFLILDAAYTAYVVHKHPAVASAQGICFTRDAVRHHSLQANCTCVRHWGKQSYPFATNSLGFRDESVRELPLTATRPRILLLGDSFTEGMSAWPDTYVGQIAAKFPQYEFLNGGIESYAPSNYLNVARKLIAQGVKFDEVIVFIDISDAQDEAAFYRDASPSGAVDGPAEIVHNGGLYTNLRLFITDHLLITNSIVDFLEQAAVKHGFYHLNVGHGQMFDLERSAWTYRPVSDTEPYEIGYAPLGLEAGLRKEESKMTRLWQELKQRNIPISVVVYPWPAQIAHDTVDSRQVQMWRRLVRRQVQSLHLRFPPVLRGESCLPGEPSRLLVSAGLHLRRRTLLACGQCPGG